MINRVLIRIKVVQLLYSYLLNQSEFRLKDVPADTSKDSRYAYNLYIDLLLLVVELAGYDVRPGNIGGENLRISVNPRLSSGKLVNAMLASDRIRSVMARGTNEVARYDAILQSLLSKIESSAVYRSYVREKKHDIKDDAQLWSVIVETLLKRDESMLAIARQSDDFTNVGYEKAFDMLVDSINGFTENKALVTESRNALDFSFSKAYELYHRLLWLMVEITDMQARRLDNARHKYVPSADDLNPDMRFVDNLFISKLRVNPALAQFIEDNPAPATLDDEVMLRKLLDRIIASDIYRDYMEASSTDYAADCDLWRKLFKTIILPSDELAESLESKSVYWNDDVDIMGEFVIKTIKRFAAAGPDNECDLMPMFKDETDRLFGPELFADAVANYDSYRSIVQRFTSHNWEMERLPFMDVVILVVAMAELINFPEIPVAVTINEYVEIANCYSTDKSGQFVNGMLSAIVKYLNEEGRIRKS